MVSYIEELNLLYRRIESRISSVKALILGITWAILTFCRIGELLSKTARTIDPLNCLLRKDIFVTKIRMEGRSVEILNISLSFFGR